MFLFGYSIQSECDFQDNVDKPSKDIEELNKMQSITEVDHLHLHTVDDNGVSSGASEETGITNTNQVCLCYM